MTWTEAYICSRVSTVQIAAGNVQCVRGPCLFTITNRDHRNAECVALLVQDFRFHLF